MLMDAYHLPDGFPVFVLPERTTARLFADLVIL